jgi:hypothetical protein
MRRRRLAGTLRWMAPASYAMVWWIGEGPRNAGRVEIDAESVSFSATTPAPVVERVRFRDVARVLLDRNVLHLERQAEPPLRVGSLDTPGALRELADVLSDAARAGSK